MILCSDAAILLWKLNDTKEPEQTPVFQEDEDALLNKESWSVVKTLRYTSREVWLFIYIRFILFYGTKIHQMFKDPLQLTFGLL